MKITRKLSETPSFHEAKKILTSYINHSKAMKVIENLSETPSFGTSKNFLLVYNSRGVKKFLTPTFNPDGIAMKTIDKLSETQSFGTSEKYSLVYNDGATKTIETYALFFRPYKTSKYHQKMVYISAEKTKTFCTMSLLGLKISRKVFV